MRFIANHPNIVIGGTLLTILLGIAIFAALLTPVDPTAIRRRSRRQNVTARHRPSFGSAPTKLVEISILASCTELACPCSSAFR